MTLPIIEVQNLTKKFGDFAAVDSISFDVQKGEIFGFLGANGAGKTTAIKMLIGLSRPTSGQARVIDYDVYTQTNLIKTHIGYMSQKFSLYEDLTIKQNIRFYGGIYKLSGKQINRKMDEILERLDLIPFKKSLVGSLPVGWKQKLAFTVSSIHDPKIVFLDEPTGGVDPVTRRAFWEMIYEASDRGVTLFVTTHYMDEASYCDRVSIMVDGRIEALGAPSDLRKQFEADNMDEVFVQLARGTQ